MMSEPGRVICRGFLRDFPMGFYNGVFQFPGSDVIVPHSIHRRCILFIISEFQYQRPQQERARHQHWKDRLVSLLLMKMTVC